MTDGVNTSAQVSGEDKRCQEFKLLGKRRVTQAFPLNMPGFRHKHRPTKLDSNGERCFYLNSSTGHSSSTYKFITAAGIETYSAHCTSGTVARFTVKK